MNDDTKFEKILEGKMVLSEEFVNDLINRATRYDAIMAVLEHVGTVWSKTDGVPVDIIAKIVESFGVKE